MTNLIHPSRTQFPTTAQEIARLAARHMQAAEPLTNIVATKVFCTNPESAPGFRHYSVSFLSQASVADPVTGKNVEQQTLETYDGKEWDRCSFTL